MTDLTLAEIFTIAPGQEADGIEAGDQEVEVIEWSNGWKTITMHDLVPEEPVEAEILPPPKPLEFAELLALARDGQDVGAVDALNLLSKYRGIVAHLLSLVNFNMETPHYKATLGRIMQKAYTLHLEEVQ